MMDTDRIKGTAKELGGKIEEAAGHLTGNDETRADGVARQIEGKGQNLYGQAKDGLRDTADMAGQAYDEGRRYVKRNSREVGENIGKHPLTSLLLAGVVGFLAGVVVRRS
jgi:uncharacterized protein YjbJ (UPF0337 family)